MAATAPPRPAPAPGTGRRSRLAALLGNPDRALLLTTLLVALAFCIDVLDDPDLWWHLRLGRWILDHHAVPHAELFSYTAAGHAMTAHEWGSEVLFALVRSAGGVLAVCLLMAAVGWSAFAALALRVRRRGASALVTAVAVLLGVFAAASVLGTRPQVITVALVSWTLLLADRHLARGGRLVWMLPAVGLVWANLHAGFVIGVGVLAATAGLEALRRVLRRGGAAPWRRIASLGGATALAAAAGLLNPNGIGLFRYALQTSASERAKPITEWQSPNFGDAANLGLLLLLASFVLLLVVGGRPSLRDLGLGAAGMAASLVSVRNTSLAVVLALPAWAVMLQQLLERRAVSRRRRPAAPGVAFGMALLAAALALDGLSVVRAAGDSAGSGQARLYPACAATALGSADGVRVFAPYFHSGHLIGRLWPRGRVYLYGESVSLGTSTFVDYGRILGGGDGGLRLLADSGTNAVLTGAGALRDTLASSVSWVHVMDDRSGLSLYATPQLRARIALPASCP